MLQHVELNYFELLINAIKKKNREGVRVLLNLSENKETLNNFLNGQCPLHIAAMQGDLAIFQLLVEKGASLEINDKDGQTPLQLAITHEHTEIVRYIMSR